MASSSSSLKYDVFLSFRGEDTRSNFTSHLFSALERNGIVVFKDDRRLEKGESIAPELLKAIEESRFSIVVLSRTYAFSSWCLEELGHIVACKNTKGHKVYPLFYGIDPSDVRKQTGSFREAFVKHEETFKDDIEKIENWKRVLTFTANLSGWHAKEDRSEADVIQEIVKEISIKLTASYRTVTSNLFGIDRQLEELKEKLCLESEDDVRFIGIWGMGGIGKTTLARVAYDYAGLHTHFDGKSFLANVRERFAKDQDGLLSLQKQLLSQTLMDDSLYLNLWTDQDGANMIQNRLRSRKVLVVIDDVDDIDQLTNLAGDSSWFGSGSKIIITSRDQHLLMTCGMQMENIYKLTPLNCQESLQLLSLHAFKSYEAPEDFHKLCNHVVDYCEGLPLALKVLGSFLHKRGVNEWESAIRQCKMNLSEKIFNVLRISYDGLSENEKDIFLDIACFFQGEEVNYVTEILDACGFEPLIGLSVLAEKCLLTIERNDEVSMQEHFWMHDLLQEMGRKFVRLESPKEPGKRSRLWKEDDIRDVLTKNAGTDVVEGIVCEGIREAVQVDVEAFSKMRRLRLLKVNKLVFSHDLTYLPSTLRLLDLEEYPFKCLPSSFQPDELVRFNMPQSSIVELWDENKCLQKLTSINVRDSRNLIKMPNFKGAVNLKFMDFTRCSRLFSIDHSIGSLKSMTKLNFRGCENLKRLPENMGELICLEELDASWTAIQTMPSMTGLKNLKLLSLDHCEKLMEICSTVGTLERLECLELQSCTSLRRLPSSVKGLASLQHLSVNGCSMLKELPEDLGEVKHLEEFSLIETAICRLPSSFRSLKSLEKLTLDNCSLSEKDISHVAYLLSLVLLELRNLNIQSLPYPLPNLRQLEISYCKRLKSLSSLSGLTCLQDLTISDCNLSDEALNSCDFGSLSSLVELNLTKNNFSSLPLSISQLSNLQRLYLDNCERLESLDCLSNLVSLETLFLKNCKKLKSLPCLLSLSSLENLDLSDCNLSDKAMISCDVASLSSLTLLDLSGNNILTLPQSISQFSRLTHLNLDNCKRLETLPCLSDLVSLEKLKLNKCKKLKSLPNMSSLSSLKSLGLSDCNLSDEMIISCDIASLFSLEELDLSNNNFLTTLPLSISQLQNLVVLNPDNCKSLESLPCLSNIFEIYLTDCERLRFIPKLPSSGVKSISASGCTSLETLPDTLPNELHLNNCNRLKLNQGCNSITLPLLKAYSQDASKYSQYFFLSVPGNQMPNWFSQQREGNGISIQVPANLLSGDSHWKGFIICIDFTLDNAQQDKFLIIRFAGDGETVSKLLFRNPCTSGVMSNHHFILFLPFLPPHYCDFPIELSHEWECWQLEGRRRSSAYENITHLGFDIEPTRGLVINKTGIRMVYEKDVEELIRLSTSQHHSLWCSEAECTTSNLIGFTRKRKRKMAKLSSDDNSSNRKKSALYSLHHNTICEKLALLSLDDDQCV